jgi:hypothetical protein
MSDSIQRCDRCQRPLPVNHVPGGQSPSGCCWAGHKLGEQHEEIECRDIAIARLERIQELMQETILSFAAGHKRHQSY